jgi:DNA helicase-2/ATP-dependent DNA helicase PcrA
LLTFTRRAAADMTRRSQLIVNQMSKKKASFSGGDLSWSGTFHAIANRLLRLHAPSISLDPSFTVLDRSDAADMMDIVRGEQKLDTKRKRFPRKGTCLGIYSRVVNSREPLREALKHAYPWCEEWEDELRGLFRQYVETKQKANVLDYDDLLLYWYYLMQEPSLAEQVGRRFDHVLVDEYQDTNALQADIIRAMKPSGQGVTAVGDDAQSIYSFRAATVRNILDFPKQFERPAEVVTLEQNYRSTQTILSAANAVIDLAPERFAKRLFSSKSSQQRPMLVTAEDESLQVDYVVERILKNREANIDLKKQAVLFRTAHHSDALEVELSRRNIPYVKFGGLKFLEAAHVKDTICILRWAENPLDTIAAYRVLQMLEGVGPAIARRALEHMRSNQAAEKPISENSVFFESLKSFEAPAAARDSWEPMVKLMKELSSPQTPWKGQLHAVLGWYQPLLESNYDAAHVRAGDLEQLEQIAGEYVSRERFLSELTLDPPNATGDQAGPPLLDEDYLILSTIHSAKGQEWDVVYVLNCADGCIPSDMATGDPQQIEEERRLLYVAMTRAKNQLHLIHPLRFYVRTQHRHGDKHLFAPLTRFLPASTQRHFERCSMGRTQEQSSIAGQHGKLGQASTPTRIDVATRSRDMW